MNELFQHTVQPIGSSTSPVEDLALEVSDAFEKLSNRLDINPNIITSYRESIGNPIFKDLKQHKITKQVSETHNILETESNIVLENIPDNSSLSLSYLYNSNNINLTEINNLSDFSNYDQYKVEGKVITLNIKVQPGTSVAITVIYTCTTFDLNNEKILPNVFKKDSGEWYLPAVKLTDNTYELDYNKNISDDLNNNISDLKSTLHIFYSENSVNWHEVAVTNYSIKNNKIEFTSETLNFNTSTLFTVYVNNTSISQLLNNLYVEFLNHNHSNSNISKNIDIKDIINRTVNLKNISYKNHKIPNYAFPQYLNREGHNSSLDGVYENSMIGKLFISRLLSADGEKYKGFDEDSNKLIFSDPVLGHSLNFNKEEQALLLTSEGTLNGLKILTKGASRYTLKLNNTNIYSNYSQGLKIEPESKILDITSNDYSNKYTVKTDNLQVKSNAEIKNLKIGDILLEENTLTKGLSIWTDNPKSIIDFKSKVTMLSADINNASVITGKVENLISDKVSIGNIEFKKDSENNTTINRKLVDGNKAIIKSTVPIEASSLKVDTLETTTLTNLKNVVVSEINVNGFRFGKSSSSDNFDVSGAEGLSFNFSSDLNTKNLYNKNFYTSNYYLRVNDKIILDSDNYFINFNDNFSFVQDQKSLDFIGSGKNTGISFKDSPNGSKIFKQFISSNSGVNTTEGDRNLFLESDVSSGVYFLKPTTKKISSNGVVFGYNDPSAERNISDLSKWFRQDVYAGKLEVSSISAATSTGDAKNGISIGSTKLSVVGPEQNCPSGLTIFESAEGIHLVQPLASETEGCNNLVYQEVTSGTFNTKGDLSVEGNATITEDLVVSGTVAGEALIITGDSEVDNLEVNDTLKVNGKTTFTAEVNFKNDLNLTNELISQSRIETKNLQVKGGTILEKNVDIGGNLVVNEDLSVNKSLNVNQGLSVNGVFKSKLVDSEGIKTTYIDNLGDLRTAGSLEVQGKVNVKNSISIQGNAEISSNLNVNNTIVSRSFYSLEEVVCRGKLSVLSGAEIVGKNITLGDSDSVLQINGKLQFNTTDVTLNSSLKIYNSLRVADDAEISGKLYNKNGIETDSYVKIVGALNVESSAQFNSNVNFKSASVSQNLDIQGSLIAANITTESLSLTGTANIANLNITNSLAMALNTNLVAGAAKFTALDLTDSSAYNNISGQLSVSKDIEAIKNIYVGQNVEFGSGSVIINSQGIKAEDAEIEVNSVKLNRIEGKSKIQPPSTILTNTHTIAVQIANSIPDRNFVKFDNLVVEGLSIFNNPVMVDTLVFNDLIYAGSSLDSEKGFVGIDIISRRAAYA